MNLRQREAERQQAKRLISAVAGGCGLKEAAEAAGCGLRKAKATLQRFGVRVRPGGPRKAGEKARRAGRQIPEGIDIVTFCEGMTEEEAAAALSVSKMTISRALAEAGASRRRGPPQVIDADQVAEMRACGFTYQQIADVLGASRSGVSRVFRDGKSRSRRLDPADVVNLRDAHGFGWDDIGRHLDCHPDTAKKLYYKARPPEARPPRGSNTG